MKAATASYGTSVTPRSFRAGEYESASSIPASRLRNSNSAPGQSRDPRQTSEVEKTQGGTAKVFPRLRFAVLQEVQSLS